MALLMAFTVSILLLGLIGSLYWVSVQRHVTVSQRSEQIENLYLVEAGMTDAIARLRMGPGSAEGIDPTVETEYCLDVTTLTTNNWNSGGGVGCSVVCASDEVRVCVDDNGPGRNQINVTAGF